MAEDARQPGREEASARLFEAAVALARTTPPLVGREAMRARAAAQRAFDAAARDWLAVHGEDVYAAPERQVHCAEDCSCRDAARHQLARSPGDYR